MSCWLNEQFLQLVPSVSRTLSYTVVGKPECGCPNYDIIIIALAHWNAVPILGVGGGALSWSEITANCESF